MSAPATRLLPVAGARILVTLNRDHNCAWLRSVSNSSGPPLEFEVRSSAKVTTAPMSKRMARKLRKTCRGSDSARVLGLLQLHRAILWRGQEGVGEGV